MRILVRADNPGGRGRFATILRNQGLLVSGTDTVTGVFTDKPVSGLYIVEIGPITITPAVYGNGIDQPPTVAAVMDPAYHANLWIVEPLKSQLKAAFTGEPVGEIVDGVFIPDEDANNILFQRIREINDRRVAAIINGIKRPEGWMSGNNVLFMRQRHVATHRSIWC